MKTLAKLLLSLACLGLLANCEKDSLPVRGDDPTEASLFSAEFSVTDFSGLDEKSVGEKDADYIRPWRVLRPAANQQAPPAQENGCVRTWRGDGHSSLFNDFTVEINLTCSIPQGETCGSFCNLTGTFKLRETGDELYFSIPKGTIACNPGQNCNEFETCFNDQATIVGGTGIFEKARGSFNPNAFIHNGDQQEWYARFKSEGSLWILRKVYVGPDDHIEDY